MNGRDAAPLKFDIGRDRSSAETQLTLKFDLASGADGMEWMDWYEVNEMVKIGN